MSTFASPPARPSSAAPAPAGLSRRNLVGLTAATVAGAAFLRPGSAFAAVAGTSSAVGTATTPAPGAVQRVWSSESTASGYQPTSLTWYTDPATGLAATPYQLSCQSNLAFAPAETEAGQLIIVDPSATYQSILGVGSSMEDSTIYNLSLMSGAGRTKALKALFDPATGSGFNLVRICFGAPDFSAAPFYTYDDGAADPQLKNFSIQKDIDNQIIATLQEALRINPNILIFGTAWSAPAWMKDSNSLLGGNLLDQYIPTLAAYYRKIVQAYASHGIEIHAVTPQNEPQYSTDTYPSMIVSSAQEQQLIEKMRAEFDAHSITTQIWAFDHNFGIAADYMQGVFGDSASGYTDAYHDSTAIAFHDYVGDPSAMTQLKFDYGNLDMIMTERMWWGTYAADRIAQYFRNWSRGYVTWVAMLDRDMASQHFTGTPNPTPLVQDITNRDTYWALPEFNMFSQYSKFVRRGAKRIYSDYGSTDTVTTVAFRNLDGTIATIVVNQSASAQQFTLQSGGWQLTDTIPAKTAGTYVWQAPATNSTGVSAYGTIQAAQYSFFNALGVQTTSDTGGGMNVGWVSPSSWLAYENVEFGGQAATQFAVRFASDVDASVTGQIEVRLDSMSNDPIAVVPVTSTGGWQTWNTRTTDIAAGVTGTHTVFLTFSSNQANNFLNVRWLTFTRGTDAYEPIKAAEYTAAANIGIENTGDTDGGQDVGWISASSWLEYGDVVFGRRGATQFAARVASGVDSSVTGQIQLRLDSPTATPIATIPITSTGGWQTWVTETAAIASTVTGTHTVYLTFSSNQADTYNFVNVNWFTFK